MTNLLISGLVILESAMGSVTPIESKAIPTQTLETYDYLDYRQTYYTVEQGELSVGSRDFKGNEINLNNENVRVVDNMVMFNDLEYGYIPIVAVSLDEVLASRNGEYTFGIYGSVIEIKYPDVDTTQKAIILDACGACRYADKIDMWLYEADESLDINGVSFDYIRYGWHEEE